MSRLARLVSALAAVAVPIGALHAAALVITKTQVVVGDSVSTLNPKALPGATVDYSLTVDNPNGVLSGAVVGSLVIADVIPANVRLRVADYGAAGSGPVEFADGNLLGLGLLGSGLSLSFKGLASDTDGVDFYDASGALIHPAPGSEYSSAVRSIKVTLTGTQAPSTRFRLRFRVGIL